MNKLICIDKKKKPRHRVTTLNVTRQRIIVYVAYYFEMLKMKYIITSTQKNFADYRGTVFCGVNNSYSTVAKLHSWSSYEQHVLIIVTELRIGISVDFASFVKFRHINYTSKFHQMSIQIFYIDISRLVCLWYRKNSKNFYRYPCIKNSSRLIPTGPLEYNLQLA